MFDNAGALNHLVTRPDQAVFYSRNDSNELASKLQALVHEIQSQSSCERQQRRRQRAEAARWLSYGEIVDSVLGARPK